MTYSFHPDAEVEFNAAIEYYETTKYGLGLMHLHRDPDYWKDRS